jgi:hypothetical protein
MLAVPGIVLDVLFLGVRVPCSGFPRVTRDATIISGSVAPAGGNLGGLLGDHVQKADIQRKQTSRGCK